MKTKNPIHINFAAGVFRALAPSIIALLGLSGLGRAAVIANYFTEFQQSTPYTGWSYLWNDGAIGTEANYKPLAYWWPEGSAYLNSATYPDPSAGYAAASRYGLGYSHPGSTSIFSIAGYQVQPGEAGIGSLTSSMIYIPYAGGVSDGVVVNVYVNDTLKGTVPVTTATGGSFDMGLGTLAVGDRVYVAVGSGPTLSADSFQIDYSIDVIPEPSTAILTAAGLFGLLAGARRRRK